MTGGITIITNPRDNLVVIGGNIGNIIFVDSVHNPGIAVSF